MRMPAHIGQDKKKLYLILTATVAVLAAACFLSPNSRRIAAALLLLPLTATLWFTVKKRSVVSHQKTSVLMIMTVMGVVLITLYYLSGIKFGFGGTAFRTGPANWLKFALPISAIIVTTECIRYVALSQESRLASGLAYVIGVMGEVFISTNVGTITRFSGFMDFVGLTLFPAVTAHALYHYLSRRYGMLPGIAYRAIITLYAFIIPVVPLMPDSLFAFITLFLPPAIYLFVDVMYEKRRRQANKKKKSKYTLPLTLVGAAGMLVLSLLIAGLLPSGMIVVATESMSGEINKGDAAFYQQYGGEPISEGEIIVFEKDRSIIVHRVVDIQYINGETRYITQGDINDDPDAGYVLPAHVVGVVTFKLPYVGYLTLWLRGLFSS